MGLDRGAHLPFGCRSLRSGHVCVSFAALPPRMGLVRGAHQPFGCRSLRSRHVGVPFAVLPPRLGAVRCAPDTFDGLRPVGVKLAVLACRLALRAFGASPKYLPRISQISLIEANSTLGCRSLRSRHVGVGSRGSPTVWVSFAVLTTRLMAFGRLVKSSRCSLFVWHFVRLGLRQSISRGFRGSGWLRQIRRLCVVGCSPATFGGLRSVGEKLAVLAFRLALRAFGASPKYLPRISQISLIEANSTFVCRSLLSRHVWWPSAVW